MKIRLVNPEFTERFGENLLQYRGINDIEWYLNPIDDKYLLDYKKLNNIERGAELLFNSIAKAKSENKKIMLITDCDNDGFTSAAIIYQYIKHMDQNILIDHRLHEGKAHGLEDHIEELLDIQQNYSLIIIPDASSNDFEYHEKLNIPCLVLDHHLSDGPFSENAIIINNQLSPDYANKELTGAGVVWQFCRYLDSLRQDNYADELTDLAAWGIIGDMGSVLSYENRYIINKGLNNIKNFFLKVLIDKQNYSMGGKINPISVAFYIVPLTNAMIRVGTSEEKERLFKAYINGEEMVPSNKRGAKGTLEYAAVESARECTNAKNHQNKIKEEWVERLKERIFKYDLLENKILFVRLEDYDIFPAELNGLIAMQLAAEFKKPTIVARLNYEGYDRGSARGINQSELESFKKYLDSTGMFEYAEGHDNAFGVSINDKLLRAFHEKANEELKDINFGESIYDVNFVCQGSDCFKLETIIKDLAKYDNIWGQNNSEPLIYVKDLHITNKDIQIIGKNSNTLKITKDGITFIKFFANDEITELSQYNQAKLDIVGKAAINEWMGRYTPQIIIENFEIKEDRIIDF